MKTWEEDILPSIKNFVSLKSFRNRQYEDAFILPLEPKHAIKATITWIADDPLDVESLLIRFHDQKLNSSMQKDVCSLVYEDVTSILKSMDDNVDMKFVSSDKYLQSIVCIMKGSVVHIANRSDCFLKMHRTKIDAFSWCTFPGMYGGRHVDDISKMHVQGVQFLQWKCVKGLGKTMIGKKMQGFAEIRHENVLDGDAVESVLQKTNNFSWEDIQAEIKNMQTWNEDTIKPQLQAFIAHLNKIFHGYVYNMGRKQAFACPNPRLVLHLSTFRVLFTNLMMFG